VAGAAGWTVLGAPTAGYVNVVIRWFLGLFGVEMRRGPLDINPMYGLVFLYVQYPVPRIFMTVAAALRNVDPALEEAARSSGSRPWRALRTVTIPSVKPAVGAGMMLAIIYALSLFSVAAIIGYPGGIEVLSVRIVNLMRQFPARTHAAVGLGFIVIAVIVIGLTLQRRLLRSSRFATISGRSARPLPVRLGIWKWPARLLMITYVVLTAIIPIIGLVLVSTQPFWSVRVAWSRLNLDRYHDLFTGSQSAAQALRNSLLLGTVGATIVMLLAAVLGVFASGRDPRPLGRLSDFSTKLPAAISHILIGVAFIAAFAGPPFSLAHSLTILLLAYIVITLPQASFSASAAYSQVGRDLEEASLASGASPLRTFARVTLPLMTPGLAAGWALVFVLMAGDLTASAMLAGPGNPVVGQFMLDQINFGTYGSLSTIAVALIVVSSVVVFTFLGVTRRMGVGSAASGDG
jgi:iron(III) transport system permease protein